MSMVKNIYPLPGEDWMRQKFNRCWIWI